MMGGPREPAFAVPTDDGVWLVSREEMRRLQGDEIMMEEAAASAELADGYRD